MLVSRVMYHRPLHQCLQRCFPHSLGPYLLGSAWFPMGPKLSRWPTHRKGPMSQSQRPLNKDETLNWFHWTVWQEGPWLNLDKLCKVRNDSTASMFLFGQNQTWCFLERCSPDHRPSSRPELWKSYVGHRRGVQPLPSPFQMAAQPAPTSGTLWCSVRWRRVAFSPTALSRSTLFMWRKGNSFHPWYAKDPTERSKSSTRRTPPVPFWRLLPMRGLVTWYLEWEVAPGIRHSKRKISTNSHRPLLLFLEGWISRKRSINTLKIHYFHNPKMRRMLAC